MPACLHAPRLNGATIVNGMMTAVRPRPDPPQDGALDGCVDSGDASSGKLRPQLNDQQLKALLTQGQAAQAKVRCGGCWACTNVCGG